MEVIDREYPRLRLVEAIPDAQNGYVILRDPTGLAAGMLVVGMPELALLSLFDGERRRTEIQAEFARRYRQLVPSHELDALLEQLDAAGFLAGPGFEAYYARRAEEYRQAPYRPLRDTNGFGAPPEELPRYLDAALAEAESEIPTGRLAGIVTPHLDFPRGLPCYGAGYRHVRHHEPPRRVVILGTNHFGRSDSAVATAKDFETPWGIVPTDREFLARLQSACEGDLMPFEMDHLREHSIELQVVWLRHVIGDDFRVVPVLCPDPSGHAQRAPGTRPGDERGVDLREFALALRRLVQQEAEPTLLVASADLSHVGRYFGDAHPLDDAFLHAVRQADDTALALVEGSDPEAFLAHMTRTGNPTRVCSVGCIYALMVALGPEARPRRLGYHQAATHEIENCVTCTAFAFYADG